ncbi:MAG: energy-coupling factor ABC transporter ATP-binding protein [Rhodospirillaceae bacterium]
MSALFELRGICFAYPDGHRVLEGIDLRLSPGDRLALLGDNGAGKSTLLQILVGLLRPTGGQIIAFGSERSEEKDFLEVRRRAGFLFQDPDDQLFCPTVAEDVAFGPLNLGKSRAEAGILVEETLAQLGLAAYADRITHKLSGGEKRLVALATVLAMGPEVLLLDEPTNALDAKARDRLLEILSGLPQAMILISHDAAFTETLATRSVLLDQGRIQDQTPYNPIQANSTETVTTESKVESKVAEDEAST